MTDTVARGVVIGADGIARCPWGASAPEYQPYHDTEWGRRAFAGFDPSVVAGFGPADVERLLADAAIVRNRAKIMATIDNARATLRLRDQGMSVAALLWKYEPSGGRPPRTMATLPASTPESKALSSELRRHGFRFVGPTTVYAAMQSLGVVNDHLEGCQFRAAAEEERAGFAPPS